jgi:hypothetical protein
MANTKDMSREERKSTKRTQRTALKKVFSEMTPDQKAKLRKSEEKMGVRQFLAAKDDD